MALLLFMTLAAWSMGSAVGSSPDEDYVLTSIWCGTEGNPPYCRKDSDRPDFMILPTLIAEGSSCYLSQGQASSAACQKPLVELQNTPSSYSASYEYNRGTYPHRYFDVARNLVSPFVEPSVVKIRLLNSLFAAVLIVATTSMLQRFKSDLFLAWLAVATPTTFYFIASVNTSSWTLFGATSFVIGLIALFQTRHNKKAFLTSCVLTVLTVIFSISSRYEGKYILLLLALALVVSKTLSNKRVEFSSLRKSLTYWLLCLSTFFIGRDLLSDRLVTFQLLRDPRLKWVALALFVLLPMISPIQKITKINRKHLLGIGSLVASLFLVYDRVSGSFIRIDILNDSRVEVDEGIRTTALNLLINNVINLPRFIMGFFGSWGLGWFELEMTHAVWLLSLQAFLLVTVFALRKSSTLHRALFVATFGVMCLAILYANQQTFTPIGQVIQPRYFLPFFLGIVIIAAANKTERYPNSLVITVAILATISNSIALRDTIRRYTTGQDVFISKSLNNPIEWWWQFGPQPETVWLAGTLAFAALWAILIYDRNKEELNAPNSPAPELAN
jgi:uncharacterized membrane protein